MSLQIAKTLFEIIQKNRSLLEIPSEYTSSEYFPDFVSKKLDSYYAFLKTNNIGKIINNVNWSEDVVKDVQLLNRIRRFKDAINTSLNLYYSGKIAKAYEAFNTSLDKVVLFKSNTVLNMIEPNAIFYRIGIGKTRPIVERSDNFHIRFDLRHFCATQRYSVSGMPSIYLGDSAYICYQELNCPSFDDAFISKFLVKKIIQIIEIQTLDNFIKQYKDENNPDLKLTHVLRFLLLYPLYVACTVKVLNDGAFKAEYIIPQLLLQYVSGDELIKGVKFPSTKINKSNRFPDLVSHNYVFPVTGNQKTGFCTTLSSYFDLTKPRSFSSLIGSKRRSSALKNYTKSDFYLIEQALLKEKAENVLINK